MKQKKSSRSPLQQMERLYKWLPVFDSEARTSLTTPEVTSAHVLKLLTFLERHISPEVFKLKNKPNRATKFLTAIRKRIGLVKVGGFMIDTDLERELFPTYGLLMTHVVNIALVSSKIGKQGAQVVASDLYYALKLMFHNENEFVLDVALCSNLSEHANSQNEVGFQLFSLVVEDWRSYSESNSSLLKYFTVASVLSESFEGKNFIEKSLPKSINPNFLTYLTKTLELNIKKKSNILAIISQIKTRRVIKISRKRLVVVSKKHMSFVNTRAPESTDESDAASISSTVVNPTSCNSNAVEQKNNQGGTSVNDILKELDIGFVLDSTGVMDHGNPEWSSQENIVFSTNMEGSYGFGFDTGFEAADQSRVFSPNIRTRSSNSKRFGPEYSPVELSDDDENTELMVETRSKTHEFEFESDGEPNPSDDDEEHEPEKGMSEDSEHEMDTKESGKHMGTYSKNKDDTDDVDSDLEILSVKVGNAEAVSDDESDGERDEADAESGEDAVPNYDEDSDVDDQPLPDDNEKEICENPTPTSNSIGDLFSSPAKTELISSPSIPAWCSTEPDTIDNLLLQNGKESFLEVEDSSTADSSKKVKSPAQDYSTGANIAKSPSPEVRRRGRPRAIPIPDPKSSPKASDDERQRLPKRTCEDDKEEESEKMLSPRKKKPAPASVTTSIVKTRSLRSTTAPVATPSKGKPSTEAVVAPTPSKSKQKRTEEPAPVATPSKGKPSTEAVMAPTPSKSKQKRTEVPTPRSLRSAKSGTANTPKIFIVPAEKSEKRYSTRGSAR